MLTSTTVRRYEIPSLHRRSAATALFVVAMMSAAVSPAATTDLDSGSSVKTLKQLSLEELMDIEVTSVSKRPEKLSETASAIQVITGDDIRRSGVTRLPEALRLATNLEVAQVDARQWAVSARGFNGTSANKLLVLIDGRTIYTPVNSGVFWDAQDVLLDDIDRIEVISGPGATLWGANAVNGVINITSKSAKDTQGGLVTAAAGDELTDFGAVRHGGTLAPNVYYRVYAKHTERDATRLANGNDASNDQEATQGGFRVDWEASDRQLTLQGDLYRARIDQLNQAAISLSGGNVLGRWSRTLAKDSDIKLQVYFDRTNRRQPVSFVESVNTYDVDFQHRLPLGERHGVVWGLGYRLIEDHIGNDYPALAFYPAQVTRQTFSAFAQDEIALVKDKLSLTLGTKIEHNARTGFEYQPSGRLAWRLSKEQTIWAAVSRAVHTPSRVDGELYAPRDPPFFQLVGNDQFESEVLLAYELGYRVQPRPWLFLSLATYYHDYDKLRNSERLNPPALLPFILRNSQEGSVVGAEFTADARVTDRWRLQAGYTQLHLELRNKPSSASFGPPTNADSNHQFSLRSSLDLPGHLEFDATYRFVARIKSQRTPAYDELDLRLGWRPTTQLELSVAGQNLLRDRHTEFQGSSTSPRQYIERSVYGKVTWRY